jgi:methylated-DNA-[protein]-cysteine S-methyltransferase
VISTQNMRYTTMPSPVGELLIAGTDDGIACIHMPPATPQPQWVRDDEGLKDAVDQLEAYFAGTLTRFELPLAPEGSEFQRRVWSALRDIPYGQTESYGTIAERIGRPGAARAVGRANSQNPIAIVVPCHRVIGSTGQLTGYAGGMERKQALLDHERGAARLTDG